MKTIIAPSLLSANFLDLGKDIDELNALSDLWFHLDIMDGHFVPNLTFGHPILKQIQERAKHPLDAHLMVTNPSFYVETLKNYGLFNVTVHYETTPHLDRLVHSIKESYPSVGVSLNPATSDSVLPDYLLKEIDLVLVMTVNPGFGGQRYIEGVNAKIDRLVERRKQLKASFQIQVDGGVSAHNAKDLIGRGVNNLVAGSSVFNIRPDRLEKAILALR